MSRFALLTVCGLIVALAGCHVVKTTAPEAADKRVYTRDAFKKLVMGKTTAEVIAAVGRPDNTTDTPDNRPVRWLYFERAMNPATAKPDAAWVHFDDDGKVDGVSW